MVLYVTLRSPQEDWTRGIDWTKNSLIVLDVKESNGLARLLAEFKGDEGALQRLNGKFTKVSRFKYLGTIELDAPVETILSGYIILNGVVWPEEVRWTVILSDYAELKRLLREFVDRKIEVKITRVVKAKSQDVLTARQEQILKIAFEAGFFDYPRKIKIQELAEKLNMSVSNLSEILRRAEKNVISNYLRGKGL
ncbi:MAG: bacterio-opsin activator HTH domain-containing protein [Candidatus Aramenus sulfurataquae]|uniref:Bacterio-opsin activator HTH domain-containing protein n=5 Tax=Candidatus Aramenus sulfurataquae TaxID=1326980 RepID=W7KLK3_9CREN|nr:MAG: bacterio-opsin activator HTH domain-containing protein [Candidatus Aramenus sulfurataquae]